MSYYEYFNTLVPGSAAKAEEVSAEFEGIQAAFDLLPTPRGDGLGFTVSFLVPEATEEGQVATWGQLKSLEDSAQTARSDAQQALNEISQIYKPAIDMKYNEINGWHQQVDEDQQLAQDYRQLAEQLANADEDVEVLPGIYSARHYMLKALAITSGARAYIGGWSGVSGALPIETPISTDAGKYWRISAAGTLPIVGEVGIGAELAIRQDLSYEVLPNNDSVLSVNGLQGAVTLDKDTIGLGQLENYAATSDPNDASTDKYALAKAVNDVKGLADNAQSTADGALQTANAAAQLNATQTASIESAQSAADNAQQTADNAQSTANSAQSTASSASSSASTNAQSITDIINGNRKITARTDRIRSDGSNLIIEQSNSGDIYLRVGGTNVMRVDANGQVYFRSHAHFNQGSV